MREPAGMTATTRHGAATRRVAPVLVAALLLAAACAGQGATPNAGSVGGAGTAAGGTTAGTAPTVGGEHDEESEWIEGVDADSDGNVAPSDPHGTAAAPPSPTGATIAVVAGAIGSTTVKPPHVAGVAGPTYTWTQLAPAGHTQVRAVVEGACPTATVDGAARPMTAFAAPTSAFPYTTCQVDLAGPARSISVDGKAVPATPTALNRIVVVGDIGCYIKAKKQQNCLDPKTFPAAQVAAQIAAAKPDLVLFVGDVYYTEAPCPASASSKCAGVPYGDNWASWAYNFFTPYEPALAAAPWVFARGNHENCTGKTDDGGAGWFQLLAVEASACQDVTAPYRIDLLDQSFIVFDSALADDNPVNTAEVAQYTPAFQTVHQLAQGRPNVWFMDHRPLWATRGTKSSDTLNLTLEAAARAAGNTLPTDVSLILSGHVHALGVFTLADGRPAQILSGGGGVKLTGKGGDFKGTAIDGTTFTKAEVQTSWGYVQFDRSAPGQQSWSVTWQELGGSVWKTCSFADRTLSC